MGNYKNYCCYYYYYYPTTTTTTTTTTTNDNNNINKKCIRGNKIRIKCPLKDISCKSQVLFQ